MTMSKWQIISALAIMSLIQANFNRQLRREMADIQRELWNPKMVYSATVPSGPCGIPQITVLVPDGGMYACVAVDNRREFYKLPGTIRNRTDNTGDVR